MDFNQIDFCESTSLWAYRHEPGAPDPLGAPLMGSIDQQFGDIVYNTPSEPPIMTQYTSGSWSWEGRYTLNSGEDTSSLFRIERDGEILVNLVAHREEDASGTGYSKKGVQLFFDGHQTGVSDQRTLEIDGVDLWDSSAWYVQIYHELEENPRIGMRILKANDKYVVENHHVHTNIEKQEFTYDVNGDPDSGPPLYWFGDANAGLGGDPDTLKYYIGDAGNSYVGPTYNPTNSLAQTVNFSGLTSHLRFWTKSLTDGEIKEHVRNPFSVATESPISSFSFMTAPIRQLNPVSGLYEELPLEKFSELYENGLPQGSWERLRHAFDNLQGETIVLGSGTLPVWDTSQNFNHLTINATPGNEKVFRVQEMTYNISSADFDFNSASNKVRIRSFQDEQKAKDNFVTHGKIVKLPSQVGVDDRRFSIESSLVHALSEDMLNLTGNSDILNNYLGAPELEYAVEYPELTKLRDLYFERIVGRVNYNSVIEFQRWFNGNFATLVEQFIPHTADFLGINFVIESHLLERHKFEYKQGDVHVDVKDRIAFEQEPIFIGIIRSEIT